MPIDVSSSPFTSSRAQPATPNHAPRDDTEADPSRNGTDASPGATKDQIENIAARTMARRVAGVTAATLVGAAAFADSGTTPVDVASAPIAGASPQAVLIAQQLEAQNDPVQLSPSAVPSLAEPSPAEAAIAESSAAELIAPATDAEAQTQNTSSTMPPVVSAIEPSVEAESATPTAPVAPATRKDPAEGMRYFHQYANRIAPKASCQNTAIAMVLSKLGWTGNPDDITRVHGRKRAQHPSGLAAVFNETAASAGIKHRLIPHTRGSFAQLKQSLDEGNPVIVHGYTTRSGHVLVATGYDDTGYQAYDPAGRWNERFKGGYADTRASAGKHVRYSKAAFERAFGTLNGIHAEPLWMHTLTLN